MTLILNGTLEQVQADLAAINALAAVYWQEQGYTVVDGVNGKELIGKIKGVDAPNAQHTLTWDVPHESPDGTWYIASPGNNVRFAERWKLRLAAAGYSLQCTEIILPEEWR